MMEMMMEMMEMHLYHHYGTNPLLEHRNLKLPGTSWYIFQIKISLQDPNYKDHN